MTPQALLKTLFALSLFFLASYAGAKPPYQVMCYALQTTMAPSNTVDDNGQGTAINWTSDVPWNDITLVLDAFYQPETNDTFTNEGAKGSALITPAHSNGERCIVSLGGAGQDGAFSTLASSAANITAFTKAVTALVSADGYDGVDIDWETPNTTLAQQTDATNMMESLYAALKALPNCSVDGKPHTLSFTTTNYITCIYNMTTLANYSDWCFWMGYDWYENPTYLVNGPLGGMPDDASAPSPCSSGTFTDDDKGWIGGITDGSEWSYPISKMILGCPLYTDDYSAGTEVDTLSILHLGTAGTYNTGYAEQSYKAPDGDTVYVDTSQSYCDKINWMHSAGLMGIGMWDMGQGLPYTDTDMAPIWSVIGGNSACLTFIGSTSTPTNTQTMTPTTANTATRTMTPTSTLAANTATDTPTLTMTHTPTSASTSTYTTTSTLTETHTATIVPPTSTLTSTATLTHTNTPPAMTSTFTSTMTVSSTQTDSATPSVTSTGTLPPTNTYTNTLTSTATVLATSTHTATSTVPASTATSTKTQTSTATAPASTATSTVTSTETPTLPVPTSTWTVTSSFTVSNTVTSTATARGNSPTSTATSTNTSTATLAYTATATFSWTPTPALTNCPGVSAWSGNYVTYQTGQEVGYNGELYECIQFHISEPNWMPPAVPALWKALGPCGSTPTSVAVQGTPVVYPNPVTSGTASIQFPSANLSNVKVQIFTVAFREVQTQNLAQVPGNEITLAMVDKSGRALADGLYYFVIQSGSSRWIEKVLVLR